MCDHQDQSSWYDNSDIYVSILKYTVYQRDKYLDYIYKTKYIIKLDIQWDYNNVWIKEGDEWKVEFWTNWGLLKLLVMFFGITNRPATFQTVMNNIFQDLILEGVICVYIDDILIYLKTLNTGESQDEFWNISGSISSTSRSRNVS